MDIEFIPSSSFSFQGTWSEVYKRYGGKGYSIQEQGKGNGNWLITRKSDVLVNGKSYRDFVLNQYGRMKLTEKLVDTFRKDVESGKIKL